MIVVVPLEPTEWPPQSPWAPGGAPVTATSGYAPPTAGLMPAAEQPGASPESPEADTTPGAPSEPNAAAPGAPQGPASGGPWGGDWRWQGRQDRWPGRAERREHSRGGPGLVFGLLLMLVGGMLAWHQIDPSFDLNLTWPVAIIALGGILVVSSLGFRNRS